MNYGELKTNLIALINRKDVTDTLAGQFINRAIDRLQRTVRPPFMERLVEYTAESGELDLPTDFIELANLYVDDRELEQVDMSTYLRTSSAVGKPSVFVRVRGQLKLRPVPEEGTTVTLHYFGSEDELQATDNENGWSISCVELVLYGAAILAADFYEDDRIGRFQEQYNTLLTELQDQIVSEAFAGPMRVQPAYSFQDCD